MSLHEQNTETLNEAGESLIAAGHEERTSSAILLGRLMRFAGNNNYEEPTWAPEVYTRLREIAEVYLRGA